MKSPQESQIVIIGAARNVERTVELQVRVFERAFASFRGISYVIIESDSTDRTTAILSELKRRRQNFHFASLGKLETEFPLRTQRLVRARNAAVEFCCGSPDLSTADFVAIADWDGVNLQLTTKAVLSCWDHDDWDVATANQPEGYYDVLGTAASTLCPGDCWEDYRKLEKEFASDVAHQIAVSSRSIKIPETHSPIDVDSAFGGLAIYKSRFFFQTRYMMAGIGKQEVCEHVAFHSEMKRRGARIIINPALVNTGSLYDSLPFFSLERILHVARRRLKLQRRKTLGAKSRNAVAESPLLA